MTVHLHVLALSQAITLLAVANGSPIFLKKVLGHTWEFALDAGIVLRDGQRLFGPSKTIRGILVSVVLTTLAAALLGVAPFMGAMIGTAAMAGDLLSSFVKRRLKLQPSSMAPGLDQVPESLLPLLVCAAQMDLSVLDVLVGVAVFWIGEIALSQLLYLMKIRDRPY